MIAFGPDTDVSATPLQQAARRALIVGCSVLALGVTSSVVRLSNPSAASSARGLATRPVLVATEDGALPPADFSAMAAGGSTAAGRAAPLELVHAAASVGRGDRVVWMLVTAYCPCPKCCGKHAAGLTASGHSTADNYGHFVAGPVELPFGSHVTVPGYNRGRAVPVYDRGGAIKGSRLDVFFPSHERALAWGRRWVPVTIAAN